MASRSLRSVFVWALIVSTLWIAAWIIASAVPVFNDLLGLISALFASWFTYGISGVFWLWLNKGMYGRGWRRRVLTGVNVGLVVGGGGIVSAVFSFGERDLF